MIAVAQKSGVFLFFSTPRTLPTSAPLGYTPRMTKTYDALIIGGGHNGSLADRSRARFATPNVRN